MKQSILSKAFTALTAVALVISQVVLPTSVAQAATGEAPPNGWQPVWCQLTNMWEAQIGETGGGSNPNRKPLTEILANADQAKIVIYLNPNTYPKLNMVYAVNGNDVSLKTELNSLCQAQYSTFTASAVTTCDDLKTSTENEGAISVTINNSPSQDATFSVKIDGVEVESSVKVKKNKSWTNAYAYAPDNYTALVTEANGSTLTLQVSVATCELDTDTVAMTYIDECNDLGEINTPKWTTELANDSQAYSYVKNVDGSYTVTAKPGYKLNITVNGLQVATGNSSYMFALPADSGAVCYKTVPVPSMPAIAYTCGPIETAQWQVPADTDAISWKIVDGELIAYAVGDWAFKNDDGSDVAFINYGLASQHTTYKACPAPVAPMFDDMTCELNDTVCYTIPEDEHNTYTIQHGSGGESAVDAGKHSLLRINQTITIRAYDINDELSGEWTHAFTIPDCKIGMGGIKPIPAPVKPAVAVQELPQTGPSDDNSYMTLLGLAASAATYGAVLLLQRRNA